MSSDTSTLDSCGCCRDLAEPAPVRNDPGLAALSYRIDTQQGFSARMLQTLPLARSDPNNAAAPRPLAGLLTRAGDDPTVALIDAAACVADVLTFYQERIANEGFLRTATERRSVLELARAIGYELKPGVAASVHLAFTVEDAPGAPSVCSLAQGTPVQSIPPQGKLPQVFETGADIVARAEWNALVPRQVRSADMALLDVPTSGGAAKRKALVLLGPRGSFPADARRLQTGLLSVELFRLDPGLAIDASVDALEIDRVYFAEAASGLSAGDLLLFVGKKGTEIDWMVLRATEVVAEPDLKRIRVNVEAVSNADSASPPSVATSVPHVLTSRAGFATAKISTTPLASATVASTVTSKAWHESDLQAMIGIQGWSPTDLVETIAAAAQSGKRVAPDLGAFAFGAKLGFFGNNAPKWGILPSTHMHDDPYPSGWDKGDTDKKNGGKLGAPRTIWQDSQGSSLGDSDKPNVLLERAVPNITRNGWAVLDAPDLPAEAYTVLGASEVSRADFGLSGRAMQLTLADANGGKLPDPLPEFKFRSTTAYVATRRIDLADLPIDTPIRAGNSQIELDRMVLGLAAGQPLALVGERFDLPGVEAAEIAILTDVVHQHGRSTLMLQQGLTHAYVRTSLKISANVVQATHGETVSEVLGNGDASVPNQSFMLKRPPTTFLSAPGGVESTLEARVAGLLWDERPSLYGAKPGDAVYITRVADDASLTLTFGDGVQGRRLPTGTLNVAASYRSGLGPDGEVAAGTLTMLRAMPLGLRSVTNPIAATGAEGPERLVDARRNAPLTLLTFERIVSLLDYENYTRAFPGIGKARGDVLSIDGVPRVFLTVVGATGGAPGADVLANLADSIRTASDPSQPFEIGAYAQSYFSVKARIAVDQRFMADAVLVAASRTLRSSFGFDARDLAQSVTAAEVIALIHTVPGVVAVDLEELLPYTGEPPPADRVADAVPAFGARWEPSSRSVRPAELLLINPAAVLLQEMAP
jgi:hypothetical protein